MKRLTLRILVLLSITLNIAFLIRYNPFSAFGTAAESDSSVMLSAQQLRTINEIRLRDQERSKELNSRLREEQNRLVSILKGGEIDRAALDRCLARINEVHASLQRLAVEQIIQCRQSMDHKDCCCLVDACAGSMALRDEQNGKECNIK